MKVNYEELKQSRKELILKGWCNNSDVQKFVPCCPQTAKRIIEKIREDVKLEGYENMDKGVILTDRLIKFMGIKL